MAADPQTLPPTIPGARGQRGGRVWEAAWSFSRIAAFAEPTPPNFLGPPTMPADPPPTTAAPDTTVRPIRKLLAANRSEIAIRVFRSAHELGIRTVAIYAHEDRFALHRFKADEAYRVGQPGEPLKSYLDIPAIITLAKEYEGDAIHPGYGLLSENPAFARACNEAGFTFVGPRVQVLENLGDKIAARRIAGEAQVPILSGSH